MAESIVPRKQCNVSIPDLQNKLDKVFKRLDGLNFLTFTLPPKMYNATAREQYEDTKSFIKKMLKQHCSWYFATIELTGTGNVHYHALAYYRENQIATSHQHRLLLLDRMKTFARFESKIVTTELMRTNMIKYITKDIHTTYMVVQTKVYTENCLKEAEAAMFIDEDNKEQTIDLLPGYGKEIII